jgi:hypothetical protein
MAGARQASACAPRAAAACAIAAEHAGLPRPASGTRSPVVCCGGSPFSCFGRCVLCLARCVRPRTAVYRLQTLHGYDSARRAHEKRQCCLMLVSCRCPPPWNSRQFYLERPAAGMSGALQSAREAWVRQESGDARSCQGRANAPPDIGPSSIAVLRSQISCAARLLWRHDMTMQGRPPTTWQVKTR